MTLEEIEELERLVALATPQNLDSAEQHKDDEWLECPFCAEGGVDGATYTNYDNSAIGVQFFGVGNQFIYNEAAYRALWNAAPALLAAAKREAETAECKAAARRLKPKTAWIDLTRAGALVVAEMGRRLRAAPTSTAESKKKVMSGK